MNDRELLEMAAKAAGYDVSWHHANQCWVITEGKGEFKWSSLDDDGDAMRLAVRLSLVINNRHKEALVEDMEGKQFWEDHEGDELAATRRAITRAAAAIGAAL